MKRKKRNRYMKINLLETSAVGIPAYPDAHMSFIKALALYTQTERRYDASNTMSETEEIKSVETQAQEETVVETQPEAEVQETVAEESKEDSAEEAVTDFSVTVDKSSEEQFAELLGKAIEQAIEKLSVKRGLVESQTKEVEQAKAELKDLSVGDLAIKSGWFRKF